MNKRVNFTNKRNIRGQALLTRQSGQALLIVLLSLTVVLTIVLFIVSRSITDITISTKEEDSLRAFSAAEAGIERALIIGEGFPETELGGAKFETNFIDFAQGSDGVTYPVSLNSGESATFWFVGHNDDGTLGCVDESCFTGTDVKFCWGDEDTPKSSVVTPALELTFIYTTSAGDYSTAQIARAALDPSNGRASSENSFDGSVGGPCTINGENFEFQKTFNFVTDLSISNSTTANILQFVKTKVLYNTDITHKVGMSVDFAGNSLLPSQGVKVESLGSFSDASRRIEVFQLHADVPAIFENAIFSSGGIVK